MKRYIRLLLLLCILLPCNAFSEDFELKQLNLGNYTANKIYIKSYNDCSLRITDYSNTQVIFNPKDTDTLLKIAKFLKNFFIEKRIPDVDTLIDFFDFRNIKYTYKTFSDSEDFFIESQSFLEDFLVPNYSFPSGYNRNDKYFQFDWDKENGYYKNEKDIYDDYTIEYFDYNGEHYKSKKYTYDDQVIVYSNHDGEHFQTKKIIFADHVEECTNYDGEYFQSIKVIYDDYIKEFSNTLDGIHYQNIKFTYDDHIEEFYDNNGEYFQTKKITYNDGFVKIWSRYDDEKEIYQKLEVYSPDNSKTVYTGGNIEKYFEYDEEKEIYQKLEISNLIDGSKSIYTGNSNDFWEKQIITDKDGIITELTNYNKDLEWYENKKVTEPSGTIIYQSDLQEVTMKDGATATCYFYKKIIYDDYYTEEFYSNWNSEYEVTDDVELKSSDLTKQCYYRLCNYDNTLNDYKNKVYMYTDRIVAYSNPDITGFYEINVYDNDNNIIEYRHVTKPWDEKKKTRDIEIFTDGIVYKYKGVTAIDENEMLKFKSCEYIDENGKKHRERNKEIYYGELVKHNWYLK